MYAQGGLQTPRLVIFDTENVMLSVSAAVIFISRMAAELF